MTNIFTDPRDGQTYRTIKIGNQIWLAENLKYKGPVKKFNNWTVEEKDFYFAPNGDRNNIKEYGCLYTWENAIRACPKGWHLPSKAEFETLLTNVGSDELTRWQNLRVTTWRFGTDAYGFSALPAGDGTKFGITAYFWSTDSSSLSAYYMLLGYFSADMYYGKKGATHSVRCIKD